MDMLSMAAIVLVLVIVVVAGVYTIRRKNRSGPSRLSALGHADMCGAVIPVRFGPIADIACAREGSSSRCHG
jgi:hypothetical protein